MHRKGDSFVNSYRGLVEWQTRPGLVREKVIVAAVE